MRTFQIELDNGKDYDEQEDWKLVAVLTCVPNQPAQSMETLVVFTSHVTNGYTEDWIDHIDPDLVHCEEPEMALRGFLRDKMAYELNNRGVDFISAEKYIRSFGLEEGVKQ